MKLNTALCETTRVLLNFPHPCPSNSKDNIVGLNPLGLFSSQPSPQSVLGILEGRNVSLCYIF